MHPALGDSGGVHAAALLLLKLRGALARLLPALWSGAPAAPEGCRLLIGQGRLLYADVLSPLVSTSLAIRAIHVVALLAPVRPTIQHSPLRILGIRLDWVHCPSRRANAIPLRLLPLENEHTLLYL